mmetsp:Transcript_4845/g.14902  ORF Transcript_4845/g.14902 Transcript_4845/m.14902 type:complete len:400 (-) Transcript_4845:517-1716(-)
MHCRREAPRDGGIVTGHQRRHRAPTQHDHAAAYAHSRVAYARGGHLAPRLQQLPARRQDAARHRPHVQAPQVVERRRARVAPAHNQTVVAKRYHGVPRAWLRRGGRAAQRPCHLHAVHRGVHARQRSAVTAQFGRLRQHHLPLGAPLAAGAHREARRPHVAEAARGARAAEDDQVRAGRQARRGVPPAGARPHIHARHRRGGGLLRPFGTLEGINVALNTYGALRTRASHTPSAGHALPGTLGRVGAQLLERPARSGALTYQPVGQLQGPHVGAKAVRGALRASEEHDGVPVVAAARALGPDESERAAAAGRGPLVRHGQRREARLGLAHVHHPYIVEKGLVVTLPAEDDHEARVGHGARPVQVARRPLPATQRLGRCGDLAATVGGARGTPVPLHHAW